MAISRDNHYVPEWYQKGFRHGVKNNYYYLDCVPKIIKLQDGGTKALDKPRPWSPSRCFCQHDLYTTSILVFNTDLFERYLFGKIDNNGAEAIRAIVENDYHKIHRHFLHLFDYLNAQKLRTPKGLDWLRTRYPRLTSIGESRGFYSIIKRLHAEVAELADARDLKSAQGENDPLTENKDSTDKSSK